MGSHGLDGVELVVSLLRQLKVARVSLLGQREVKYVVVERQL